MVDIPQASVIIPIYQPDKKVLNECIEMLKKQTIVPEIIQVDLGLKELKQLNIGIKKAKSDIIITLGQDCIPTDEKWVEEMIRPFQDKNIIAANSDLILPYDLWKNFDLISRTLTLKEQKQITPMLDGRATAYRKSILKEIGYMNEERQNVAGDDDTYFRLRDKGQIVHPHCSVYHVHPATAYSRLILEFRDANGAGSSMRMFSTNMPGWWKRIIRITPVFGFIGFLGTFPIRRSLSLLMLYILLLPIIQTIYITGFWKGFITKAK
jgi:glycosyltransferase involved in cell wall biosynthesis